MFPNVQNVFILFTYSVILKFYVIYLISFVKPYIPLIVSYILILVNMTFDYLINLYLKWLNDCLIIVKKKKTYDNKHNNMIIIYVEYFSNKYHVQIH